MSIQLTMLFLVRLLLTFVLFPHFGWGRLIIIVVINHMVILIGPHGFKHAYQSDPMRDPTLYQMLVDHHGSFTYRDVAPKEYHPWAQVFSDSNRISMAHQAMNLQHTPLVTARAAVEYDIVNKQK